MEESEVERISDQSDKTSPTVLPDSPLLDWVNDESYVTERSNELCFTSVMEKIPVFDDARLNGASVFSDDKSSLARDDFDEQGLPSENSSAHIFPDKASLDSLSSENEVMSESEHDTQEDPNELEIEMHVNDQDADKLDETVTQKNDNDNVRNRISGLHCYICGKLYTDPKLLNCLHTFCLECLESLVFYKDHQRIECVVCHQKTQIPFNGMTVLPDNVVIKNLLAYKLLDDSKTPCCDVCKMHGLENEVSGKCMDCNDALCSECCEIHTFTRQTVSHSVLSLQDIKDSDWGITKIRENFVSNCPQHKDEKLKFYCVTCQNIVCRDCVLVSHNLHQVVTTEKVMGDTRDGIAKKIDQLSEAEESKQKELEEYENAVVEEERKQRKSLETVYQEMRASLEEKYQICQNDLTIQYSDLKEKVQERKEKLQQTKNTVEEVKNSVQYIMEQGLDSEIASLQTVIKKQLDKLLNDYKRIDSAINMNSPMPSVDIYGDNCMTLQKMNLFRVMGARKNSGKSNSRQAETGESEKKLTSLLRNLGLEKQPKVSMKPAGMRQEGLEMRTSDMRQEKFYRRSSNEMQDGFDTRPDIGQEGFNMPLGFEMRPAGFRQDSASIQRPTFTPGQANATSLLGDYFLPSTAVTTFNASGFMRQQSLGILSNTSAKGHSHNSLSCRQQNLPQTMQETLPDDEKYRQFVKNKIWNKSQGSGTCSTEYLSKTQGSHFDHNIADQDSSSQSSGSSFKIQGRKKFDRLPRANAKQGELFVLKETLSVRVLKDVYEPNIVGMTFLGRSDFAISDARNQKIKIFSICGKFLYFLYDRDPMTVTFCNSHLVWNANTDKILTRSTIRKDLSIHKKRFQPDMAHPVTTFQDNKYLVANVQGKIAAFQVDGALVSEITPYDSSGLVIENIHSIAAGKRSHIALIDSEQQKVVIMDPQGRCTGEFTGNCDGRSPSAWKAGCVSVTERDNVFVSDTSRNRVLLLSETGKLLKEWITLIDSPNCITTNGAGVLLVAGVDKSVNVYNYNC